MKSINFYISSVLLICCLFTGITFSDTLSDTNRLLNWAEAKYPQLFSPAGQTTKQWKEWLYRYYPSTQNYTGVNINNLGAYVQGDVFGGLRYKGQLADLLVFIEKNPADHVQVVDMSSGIDLLVNMTSQSGVVEVRWTVSSAVLSQDANDFELQLYVGGGEQWYGLVTTDEPTEAGIPLLIGSVPDNFCFRMIATIDHKPPILGSGTSGNEPPCR